MTPDRDLFEPITYENIHELEPGEWIWDNCTIERKVHKRTIYVDITLEPAGFRQIHIIDLDLPKMFMLTHVVGDVRHYQRTGYIWEYFELGRYFRFKKNKGEEK